MTTRISRPSQLPLPRLSVLGVSAQLCDNRFPSFLPFAFYRFRQESPSNKTLPNPFKCNIYKPSASVDSKPLTRTLNPLDATLTKNIGEGRHLTIEDSGQTGKYTYAEGGAAMLHASFYAEALLGTIRRSGFAPGIGNCMCQKFISGEINSTPIYCLPSRARWMETTRLSIDCAVLSFIRISVCPTNTISSS